MAPRRLSPIVIAAAAATAVAAVWLWVISDGLEPLERIWTVALTTALPAALILQAAMVRELDGVPREAVYLSSGLTLWGLAAVTFVIAVVSGTPPAAIGLRPAPAAAVLLWCAAVLVGGLAVLALARFAGIRESAVLRQLLPGTGRERTMFVGLSLTAGFCEELVFRGFLIGALFVATSSMPVAVLISSAAFGVLHAYQDPAGAVRAALLGALLALPLIATGSLLPSMMAHAAIDIVAGLWLRDRLIRSR
jgi:membrane protease YdiL (CAAX protease family)